MIFFFFLLKEAFLGNIQQCHSNAGSTETFTIIKKKDGNDPVIALHLGVGGKKLIRSWILQNVRDEKGAVGWAERAEQGGTNPVFF